MGNKEEAVDYHVPDSNEGTLDDRYQLGPILGRGAMSTVYRATDLLLGRDVAIKIFLPGSGDVSFRARQETEMRLLASFDHPGLVAAFDAGVDTRNDEERAYLVMELAEGCDLRAVLSDGPLTVPETARIGIQIAGALSQVHEQGVIHRDMKPANILVSDDDALGQTAKLADFGVALVMDDNRLTATGFTVGTAQYLSPEQAQGLHLTPASDIYSLGLVLLECLTGKAEYPGTPMETASARLHRAPEIPLELPGPLRSLLEAMTDMDPALRPSAHDVEQALAEDRIQSGRRTAVLPQMPSRPPLRATPVRPAVRATTRTQTAVAGLVDLGRRRPKTVRGVAAAAVTVPLALLMLTQGLVPTGTTTDTTKPAESGVSQAEPQPSTPAAPVVSQPAEAVPAEVAPAEVPPAEVVNLQEPVQPAPAPAPVVPAPAPAVGPGNGANKSDGKSEKKPEKAKGNGEGK